MGFFFTPTGKGSVYVACGNRMGGNELRFPRVGKCGVKSGATPLNHSSNKWRKRKGTRRVVDAVGSWWWGQCGCARMRSRGLGVGVHARLPSQHWKR